MWGGVLTLGCWGGPLHLGRPGGRGGGAGCGVEGAVLGMVVDQQLSFRTRHPRDHVAQSSERPLEGALSSSPVHSGARGVAGCPHVCEPQRSRGALPVAVGPGGGALGQGVERRGGCG